MCRRRVIELKGENKPTAGASVDEHVQWANAHPVVTVRAGERQRTLCVTYAPAFSWMDHCREILLLYCYFQNILAGVYTSG